MITIITLPRGVTVGEIARATRRALATFGDLRPERISLEHWLTVWYRPSVVAARSFPFAIPYEDDIPSMIEHVQSRLVVLSKQARHPAGDFVEELPTRVNIARVRDAHGAVGFAHVDLPSTSLYERVLALFLADYLSAPEQYLLSPAPI
ncbi:MAG TPA: hypothetical protein VGH87_24730 [Polyangiaceae bacterium]|jgi:hypothetical protein